MYLKSEKSPIQISESIIWYIKKQFKHDYLTIHKNHCRRTINKSGDSKNIVYHDGKSHAIRVGIEFVQRTLGHLCTYIRGCKCPRTKVRVYVTIEHKRTSRTEMLWKRADGFPSVSRGQRRRRWKGCMQWPSSEAKKTGNEKWRWKRLFAMADKRTLDIYHCQHSVNRTLSIPRTILDKGKSVIDSAFLIYINNIIANQFRNYSRIFSNSFYTTLLRVFRR